MKRPRPGPRSIASTGPASSPSAQQREDWPLRDGDDDVDEKAQQNAEHRVARPDGDADAGHRPHTRRRREPADLAAGAMDDDASAEETDSRHDALHDTIRAGREDLVAERGEAGRGKRGQRNRARFDLRAST